MALVCAADAAGGLDASGATPQCGEHCINIFSKQFGTAAAPNLVETVSQGVAKVGQPTILHRASNTNPAEDFMVPRSGLVSDFYKAGLVSADVNQHYGTMRAAEIEYAPSGVASHLCVGLATAANQDQGLSLQACDTPGTTVWIIDTADSPAPAADGFFPLVNGSTTDFDHPFVMTYPSEGGQREDAQIVVRHLVGNPDRVPDNQLWGTVFGVLS